MVQHIHDTGYKFLLSHKRVFYDCLRRFLKVDWIADVDPDELIQVDKSYILPDYSNQESDVVYRARLGEKEIIIYFLNELQSTVDYQMAYRLLQYIVEIMRDIWRNTDENLRLSKDFQMPMVVPIVIYNGAHEWTAPLEFRKFIEAYQRFGDLVINFRYELIDVNRMNEQTLQPFDDVMSTVFLMELAFCRQS